MEIKSKYFRISLTDKCNLNCTFCHNEGQPKPETKSTFLEANEIIYLSRIAKDFGYTKFKLTGGEPTLHPQIIKIVEGITNLEVEDLSIITNGTTLKRLAEPLKKAGLQRLNVSLYTLNSDKFKRENGGTAKLLNRIVEGIDIAIQNGFDSIKLNYIWVQNNMEDFLSVVEFANKRSLTIVLLPVINFNNQNGKEDFTLLELYLKIKDLGIIAEKIITDNEGIQKKLITLSSGAKILLRTQELKDKFPFSHCISCTQKNDCREGIFPTRLSADATLHPCLADNSYSFSIREEVLNRDDDKIKNAFLSIQNLGVA